MYCATCDRTETTDLGIDTETCTKCGGYLCLPEDESEIDLEAADMPERIWAGDFDAQGFGHCIAGQQGGLYAEYVRADLVTPAPQSHLHGPYGWLIKPVGLAEDAWYLANDPSEHPDEEVSIPLFAKEEQALSTLATEGDKP